MYDNVKSIEIRAKNDLEIDYGKNHNVLVLCMINHKSKEGILCSD